MARKAFPENPAENGILHFIHKLFQRKSKAEKLQKKLDPEEEEFHLEPEYWLEVKDFIDNLNHLIEAHTISDGNVQRINQRIVNYIVEQINLKGSLTDIDEKYSALNTLADRLMSNTFSKIVGLKHENSTHAEFSNAVDQFKKRLEMRHQHEAAYFQSKH
ncbi:MAG: hypothetical protein JSS07_08510 [Proteobacteria bacterium]|nr:hypothetical protein [Pseudomonadota bacterium]